MPCKPHKEFQVHCVDDRGATCPYYDATDRSILIIKLGAIGDVIRTTPLLRKLRTEYPRARIFWLTHTPEILPSLVDRPLSFSPSSLTLLRSIAFDLLINLDKDPEACALAEQLRARKKKGFILRNGLPAPIDAAAQHKYFTGVFDDISKANTKSYPEEIFEICGFTFSREEYLLDVPPPSPRPWRLPKKKKVIGLNTGCGGRWTSRLWPDASWIALAKRLKQAGYQVVLLGGEQEDQKNRKLARASGATYFGHFPLTQFMDLVNRCDLVVTAVTMAMHITIGLGKKMVLMNNIFNPHEFELYGRGVIVEPDRPCRCFYQPTCTNSAYRCMEHLTVDRVLRACRELLPAK